MCNMSVHTVLVILLMLPAAVKTDSGGVNFWRDTVTLTCPEEGEWFDNKVKIKNTSKTYEFPYGGKVGYRCEYKLDDDDSKIKKYYFHVEGKACKTCFELDASLFLVFIIGDVVMTAIVMVIICKCTKKKGSAAPVRSSKAPSGGRAPADLYEHLNPNTRSDGTYSVVNKTG